MANRDSQPAHMQICTILHKGRKATPRKGCHGMPGHVMACNGMPWHAMPWHAKACLRTRDFCHRPWLERKANPELIVHLKLCLKAAPIVRSREGIYIYIYAYCVRRELHCLFGSRRSIQISWKNVMPSIDSIIKSCRWR